MIDLDKTQNFSAFNAYRMAELSESAYLGRDEFSQYAKSWGMEFEPFDMTETECYLAWDEGNLLLVFRGTESYEIDDWLTDVRIRKVGGIHRGFKEALDKVWKPLSKLIKEKRKTRPLIITGHSLGGALAQLASLRSFPELIYTFGSPRAMDLKTAKGYDKLLGNVTHRVVNRLDFVPRLPPRALNYSHVGQLAHISHDDRIRHGEGIWQALLDGLASSTTSAIDRFIELKRIDLAGDHSIGAYKQSLARAV